jgi:hypothetical protein
MGALWKLPGSSLGALWELVAVAGIVALQNAAPAAAAAPPACAATVVFTDMPQMLGTDDLIDYSTKRGSTIF